MEDVPVRDSGYSLLQRGRVVAEFDGDDFDWPWLRPRLVASYGFEDVRNSLSELREKRMSPPGVFRAHRRLGLSLVAWPQGQTVRRFLLWIDEDGTASLKIRPPLWRRLRSLLPG